MKSGQTASVTNVDRQWVPDFRRFHTELNVRLAVSVRVLGTNRRRASVDCSERVVSWHCNSSL